MRDFARRGAGILLALSVLATSVSGQELDRRARVSQAVQSFDFREAVELLMPVLDPALAGTDSLWSAGVKGMATVLLDVGLENADPDADLAGVWLRWGLRLGGALPVDPVYDLEAVRSAYAAARGAVADDAALDASVDTEWEWSPVFDASADGRLAVAIGVPDAAGASFVVDGRRLGVSEMASLAPGTYRVEVQASGYEPVAVDREVLPGVTTRLRVEPVPALPEAVRSAMGPSVVQLAYAQGGSQLCTNGVALGPTAVVARPATVSRTDLRLVGDAGSLVGPSQVSEGDGIGVALASIAAQGPWPRYGTPAVDQWAWALYRAGCAPALADERVRVAAVDRTEVVFDRSVAPEAVGGALVDRSGALLGIVAAADRATLLTNQAQLFLEQAIVAMNTPSEPAENPSQSSGGGGGVPWKWIGGAGAAGALAIALIGGGGGGGSDTGEIVVLVPGG